MYIGTYGTLRHGQGLHPAIQDCPSAGMARISGNFIMVRTPAGFPAIMEVNSGYMHYIHNSEPLDYSNAELANEWSGGTSGFDYPLLELYDAQTSAIVRRLDMVEGYPHLYQRKDIPSYMVEENSHRRVSNYESYTQALDKFTDTFPDLTTEIADTTTPYTTCYTMSAKSEWLQGCEIVWNGDYCNPRIHPTVRFDYNMYLAALTENMSGRRGVQMPVGVIEQDQEN